MNLEKIRLYFFKESIRFQAVTELIVFHESLNIELTILYRI